MRAFPLSLLWFVVAAVVVVLQMIPLTGIMLMLVMAAFWSVFLVNAGFLSLALEALLGGTSRKWLVLPIAWFLGYGAVAWQSHTAAARFLTDIDAFNAGKSLSFDPENENLVFLQSVYGTLSAEEFVKQYDMPLTFLENPNLRTAGHLVYTIGTGDRCHQIRKSYRMQAAMMRSSGDYTRERDKEKPWRPQKVVESPNDKCSISSPYEPVGAVVKVKASTERFKSFLLAYDLIIPASRQNPKKLRVDDAEVICDGIAELVPFSGHGLS